MLDVLEVLVLLLAGLFGGVLAGLLGIGGGIIYIFVLGIALEQMGVPANEIAQYTIANSFFAIVFASLSANVELFRKKQFYWKPVLFVGGGAIVASLLTRRFIVQSDWFSRDNFNVIVVLLLLYMLYRVFRQAKVVQSKSEEKELGTGGALLSGISGGFVASLSGLGGGVVMVPILNTVLKLDFKKARSISLGVILMIAIAVTFDNLVDTPEYLVNGWTCGYIVFPLGISLAVGVIVGAPLGVKLSERLSSKTVSYLYVGFLALFILKKIVELAESWI